MYYLAIYIVLGMVWLLAIFIRQIALVRPRHWFIMSIHA